MPTTKLTKGEVQGLIAEVEKAFQKKLAPEKAASYLQELQLWVYQRLTCQRGLTKETLRTWVKQLLGREERRNRARAKLLYSSPLVDSLTARASDEQVEDRKLKEQGVETDITRDREKETDWGGTLAEARLRGRGRWKTTDRRDRMDYGKVEEPTKKAMRPWTADKHREFVTMLYTHPDGALKKFFRSTVQARAKAWRCDEDQAARIMAEIPRWPKKDSDEDFDPARHAEQRARSTRPSYDLPAAQIEQCIRPPSSGRGPSRVADDVPLGAWRADDLPRIWFTDLVDGFFECVREIPGDGHSTPVTLDEVNIFRLSQAPDYMATRGILYYDKRSTNYYPVSYGAVREAEFLPDKESLLDVSPLRFWPGDKSYSEVKPDQLEKVFPIEFKCVWWGDLRGPEREDPLTLLLGFFASPSVHRGSGRLIFGTTPWYRLACIYFCQYVLQLADNLILHTIRQPQCTICGLPFLVLGQIPATPVCGRHTDAERNREKVRRHRERSNVTPTP